MPVIDGKVHRATFRSLKLNELSSVDRPAQAGAKAVIMKRDGTDARADTIAFVAKYMEEADARTFTEMLEIQEFDRAVWPMTDALQTSIRSIIADKDLSQDEREEKISQTMSEFLAALRAKAPTFQKGDHAMAKTVEQLEADVAALKAENATLKTERDAAVAKADKASADCEDAMKEKDEAKKALAAATDEVVKVDDTEVRKSEVGPAQFALTKALIDKADKATFEKRAQDEFPNVVGTAAEKGLVLKAMAAMSEDTQKALTAIMTAAEKMTSIGFGRIGTSFPGEQNVAKAEAEAGFTAKVHEVAKRDNIPLSVAMGKARAEFPAEFAKAYPDAN